jgi:hypothetical protein
MGSYLGLLSSVSTLICAEEFHFVGRCSATCISLDVIPLRVGTFASLIYYFLEPSCVYFSVGSLTLLVVCLRRTIEHRASIENKPGLYVLQSQQSNHWGYLKLNHRCSTMVPARIGDLSPSIPDHVYHNIFCIVRNKTVDPFQLRGISAGQGKLIMRK